MNDLLLSNPAELSVLLFGNCFKFLLFIYLIIYY